MPFSQAPKQSRSPGKSINDDQQQVILTLCLTAAFAEGGKDERERAEIKRIADTLAGAGSLNIPALCQDVVLRRVTPAGAVTPLESRETRQLADEMRVCVRDPDGTQSDAELCTARGLDAGTAQAYSALAESIAAATVAPAAHTSTMSGAELDEAILDASILNARHASPRANARRRQAREYDIVIPSRQAEWTASNPAN